MENKLRQKAIQRVLFHKLKAFARPILFLTIWFVCTALLTQVNTRNSWIVNIVESAALGFILPLGLFCFFFLTYKFLVQLLDLLRLPLDIMRLIGETISEKIKNAKDNFKKEVDETEQNLIKEEEKKIAENGALSLPSENNGTLALAEENHGALSLAKEKT